MTTYRMPLPAVEGFDQPVEVWTDAFIAEHGGRDVSGYDEYTRRSWEGDGNYVGTVLMPNGAVVKLTATDSDDLLWGEELDPSEYGES